MRAYQYLFGPVPSRRFGRSLGVDLVPRKTCSLNCVFCQLGPTAQTTRQRREYVPTEAVLEELEHWLAEGGLADFITLSGSGEPTLHTRFGDVLQFARRASSLRTALLTNGTLLFLPEVRAAACHAHVVKVSLCAWDESSFVRLHRPHPGLTFEQLLQGQRALRAEFRGELWLEVVLVDGFNATLEQVRKIAELARTLRPDRIHLNTVVRPPADPQARPIAVEQLQALADLFTPRAEVLEAFRGGRATPLALDAEAVLQLLRRRPCTAEQLAELLGEPAEGVAACLETLCATGRARREARGSEIYYLAS